MDIRRRTAAALAGLALLIGGTIAGCAAATGSADTPQTTQTGTPPGRQGSDTSALVAALVSTFDLDEATVQTAVDDAISSLMGRSPGGGSGQPPGQGQPPTDAGNPPSTPPTDSGSQGAPGSDQIGEGGRMPGSDRLAEQLATSIATALKLDEAEVLTVVQANLPQLGGPGGGQGGPGRNQDTPSPQPTTTG